ncbi:hypothetical protein NliqN6_4230 [Naganishia liquefaciens]|uniref:Glycosyl hydrolase family 88 n=1 Tax=Naganishia liquefaciens TaxID=104408 RepID=A0A8H3TVU8_9TREE|nr:hypothetical protein NliqN6_4230 [Naganishia liquefaciens]
MSPLQPLDEGLLEEVVRHGVELSKGSWEIGTLFQARLEYDHPGLTPFGNEKNLIPPRSLLDLPALVLHVAKDTLNARPTSDDFPAGKGQVLCRDDAAGDPASLGIACLLFALAEEGDVASGGSERLVVRDVSMLQAVRLEAEFLEKDACRTEDGAISHRLKHLSLWADFVYMVPPFLAFLGLMSDDQDQQTSYFQAAYDQCRLYRQYLRRGDGLWKHIIMGPDKIDPWPWATSNGWAAAGMLRVHATLQKADQEMRSRFRSQLTDLGIWALEIIKAAAEHVDSQGMVREYIDEPDFEGESCGTALLAYAAYRLAYLGISHEFVPFAERARKAVHRNISPQGLLEKVCDIVDERKWRERSAEGQAFVIMLEAAARDYVESLSSRNGIRTPE